MLAVLAAVAGAAGGEDLGEWLRTLGSFSAAAGIGYVAYRREAKRADSERAAYAALVERVMVDVIPALKDSTSANQDVLAIVQENRWREAEDRRSSPGPGSGRR